MNASILRAEGLQKTYQKAVALDGVSVNLACGGFLAIVGRSGSGKSTLVRCLAGLETPDAGQVWFESEPIVQFRGEALRRFRQSVQLVQQDAAQALNPHWDALTLVREPLDILRKQWSRENREKIARASMQRVGLSANLFHRHPSALSGGQRQRVQLARAMALSPKLLLLDEPLTGLDPTIQAEFLATLARMRDEDSLTCVFVTHDIETAWSASTHIAVMNEGRIVANVSPGGDPSSEPMHPYAAALLQRVRQRKCALPPQPYIKRESRIP